MLALDSGLRRWKEVRGRGEETAEQFLGPGAGLDLSCCGRKTTLAGRFLIEIITPLVADPNKGKRGRSRAALIPRKSGTLRTQWWEKVVTLGPCHSRENYYIVAGRK